MPSAPAGVRLTAPNQFWGSASMHSNRWFLGYRKQRPRRRARRRRSETPDRSWAKVQSKDAGPVKARPRVLRGKVRASHKGELWRAKASGTSSQNKRCFSLKLPRKNSGKCERNASSANVAQTIDVTFHDDTMGSRPSLGSRSGTSGP